MRLKCVSAYRNGALGLSYNRGQLIEVDKALGMFLLRDSPESFDWPLARPPEDRAVGEAVTRVVADVGDGVEAAVAGRALRKRRVN